MEVILNFFAQNIPTIISFSGSIIAQYDMHRIDMDYFEDE
jgi:hypothetical protein